MVDSTQPITSPYSTKNNDQIKTNIQQPQSVVVPNQSGVKIHDAFEVLGISPSLIDKLLAQYSDEQLISVLKYAENRSLYNPAGFVVQALRQNWVLAGKEFEPISAQCQSDPRRYVTGKYAHFIDNHP